MSGSNGRSMSTCDASASIDPTVYPLARKDESVVDNFHGTMVPDPYRWLEDPDSPETKEYVNKLNAVSEPFIAASKIRQKMKTRLTEIWDYEKFYCPSKRGKYYYYFYNSGLQNQCVLYQQRSLEEKGEVFLDPNKFSDDGTTAIRSQRFSKDGSILAYGISEKGSDWMTLKFRTCENEELDDVVHGVKHSDISWLADNSGVFYSKYPEHKGVLEGSSAEKHEYHSLYFHKMGTAEDQDVLVADFRSDPALMCSGTVTEDGRYLIVTVSRGCDPNNLLYFYDLNLINYRVTGKLNLEPLFTKDDAAYEFVDNDGDSALIRTNYKSPMFKLIRVKLSSADDASAWETVIETNECCKLHWVVPVYGDRLVVSYLEDVKTALYVYCSKTGEQLCRLPLDIGTVSGFFGKKSLSEIFMVFESFFTPGIVYHADLASVESLSCLKLRELHRVNLKGLSTDDCCVKQVFYKSADGTKVPMYVLSKKDAQLNGQNPTILNGYGGFNIADLPYFSISRIFFLKHFNGVYACANLRGGSEYGEKWHEDGMLDKKQNVFDDFIAAAEYLIENKYTSPKKLAIHGGSNGGLLVAACSQQRPDLYGAVINRVGVMDMLRYHKFTIGSAWLPEYGNPDEPADFPFIFKYSPLHNIRMPEKCQWPSTLLMTADHDDRVVPSHSLKYIARLYEVIQSAKDIQTNPLLIRIEVKAGHGCGKPTTKIIDELVDMFCFLERVLGLQWIE